MLGSMGGGGGAQATAALGVMGMGGDKGCMPNLTYRQVPNKEHRPSAGNCHRPPAHTSLWHKPPSGPCQRRIALRGCVRSSVNHTPPISLSYRNLLPPVNASFPLSPYHMYPPLAAALSRSLTQRLYGFGGCFVLGLIISVLVR